MIHVHCSYTSHGQHHEATHRLPSRKQVMALIADRLSWHELTRMEIVPQGRKAETERKRDGGKGNQTWRSPTSSVASSMST